MKRHVLLCVPSYKYAVDSRLLPKMWSIAAKTPFSYTNLDSSATCMTFNIAWAQALDAYERGEVTHFAMWHSDIIPDDLWLDKLAEIMDRESCDVVSAIVPIKDANGFTSTALDEPVGDLDPEWRVRRLTMKEIHKLPPTFTAPNLLLNTGLMLVDLSKEWTKDAYFTIRDKIFKHHGRRVAAIVPEDWGLSRMARAGGAKLCATREVKVEHVGDWKFSNAAAWGSADTDFLPTWPKHASDAADAANAIRGYMTWEELAWLAEMAANKDVVVEVGSWLGRSTKALAATARGQVFAVDHWRGSVDDPTEQEAKKIDVWAEFNHNLGPEINRRKVIPIGRPHEELSSTMTWFDGMTQDTCPVGPADMIFIDGSHKYEDVVRDIKNAVPMLKEGGLLCGHDFNEAAHPGVVQAVKELVPGFRLADGTSIWYAPPKAGTGTRTEQTTNNAVMDVKPTMRLL